MEEKPNQKKYNEESMEQMKDILTQEKLKHGKINGYKSCFGERKDDIIKGLESRVKSLVLQNSALRGELNRMKVLINGMVEILRERGNNIVELSSMLLDQMESMRDPSTSEILNEIKKLDINKIKEGDNPAEITER